MSVYYSMQSCVSEFGLLWLLLINRLIRRSRYWLIDVRKVLATKESTRRMIELAVASGVPCLALCNWAETAGHYAPGQKNATFCDAI